jgi:UDP-glucuronate 4-epimerase
MKYLITGAAGFIGFHLAKSLAERGDEVLGLDSINDYYDPALKLARLSELGLGPEAAEAGREAASTRYPNLSFVRLGLEDRSGMEALFARRYFDRVCNLAAQAGVRYSIENPRAYVESNVVGFLNVLECCRSAKAPHLVYASSSSVYGLNSSRPFSVHEGTNHPMSMYAATKKADELMAHAYSQLYGLPTTGLRFFTVYGPWGRPDMAYFKFARAIAEGRAIDVYNGGDMLRDFTYIDDVVEGLLRVLDRAPAPDPDWSASNPDPASSSAPYRVYNIGNNRPVRLGGFIDELERALGAKAERRCLPMQPGDVYATEADVSELERDFGWKPSTTIEEGLARFARWFADYGALVGGEGRKAVAD